MWSLVSELRRSSLNTIPSLSGSTPLPRTFLRFAIDRGGTFTDVVVQVVSVDNQNTTSVGNRVLKLLSVDPGHYDDAPREAIRRVLNDVFPDRPPIAPTDPIPTADIDLVRMGTTVATNALLERQGQPSVFLVTEGFADLLRIGNQARPDLFDISLEKHRNNLPLYDQVVEVPERLLFDSDHRTISVRRPLDEKLLIARLRQVRENHPHITSVAVALLHSYTHPAHEQLVGKICQQLGFQHVSLSSQLTPMVKIVPRGYTAVVDAYLTPKIKQYVENFKAGFQGPQLKVQFMQSDGGLCDVDRFTGYRALLSGPAGGVVGYARTAYDSQTVEPRRPVIGFDMGGTSTDVSRYGGRFEHVFETQLANVTVQAPQLDIQTVAAGGGSRLFYRMGMFQVGPQSAGAFPGPVCYRRPGGLLAITDANVVLGRIQPEFFPNIFGPSGTEPLDVDATRKAFEELTAEINNNMTDDRAFSVEEVAMGFVDVANESMCRPIRTVTEARGFDTRDHALACFGGAGGQHACAIARNLGMHVVYVHKYSGILSAYGIGQADSVVEKQLALSGSVDDPIAYQLARDELTQLSNSARNELLSDGVIEDTVQTETFLHMRYDGTDFGLMVPCPADGDYRRAFEAEYHREHGFSVTGKDVLYDDIRVRVVGSVLRKELASEVADEANGEVLPVKIAKCYFKECGWVDTSVFSLDDMQGGLSTPGPALVVDVGAGVTVVIDPRSSLSVTPEGNLEISIGYEENVRANENTAEDPVSLALFSNRFMGIAEQMGRTLQRTAISTNIKERLDFSCAIFDDTGGLVANAPHVPVHLGSMQDAVRYQIKTMGNSWYDGEVILANHPEAGGTHLPDITVITPVNSDGKPCFYMASRGHQCDIGGISPGSMPPFSKSLRDEGMSVKCMKIVCGNEFQEEALRLALMDAGARCPDDVVSDLKAQVAANRKGIGLMQELIQFEGLSRVVAHMKHIQQSAARAVESMLKGVVAARGQDVLTGEDKMDDGSCIRLTVKIDGTKGRAVFDFSKTDDEVYGNTNAPASICKSAIIYCLRCMIKDDIPLNQGCLDPVEVVLRPGSLLSPSNQAAVVGGNVLTSQRITDVIFRAFGAVAASQGCMNNLTFGDEAMGYYETIAGGCGAGPSWNGSSGVHSHMTNTRITDPEILERRYPVTLVQFGLRPGSGGDGEFHGGNGVVREIQMKRKLNVSILSERRVFAPYGLNGGMSGGRGKNMLIRTDGKCVNLSGRNELDLEPGEAIRILSPGGGGFGKPK